MTDVTNQYSLSKSKLVSADRCLKRLYLSVHQPKSAILSDDARLAIRNGELVGEMAKQIYGTDNSIEIALQHDRQAMVRETAALIDGGADFPIFEATFEHEGVLVRVDVLLPDGDGWRAVEIKGSTKLKKEHKIDCAIQWWVMRGTGLPINSIALGHVNSKTFIYQGDGDYNGLIVEEDLTELSEELSSSVPQLVEDARATLEGPTPDIGVGGYCTSPYKCDFRHICWPLDCNYPVTGLGGYTKHQAVWVNRGITDLREVPAEEITKDDSKRVHRVTCTGKPELLDGAREKLDALEYPRYHLDFETIGPAIPFWKGMKPYKAVPVQWSIHIDDGTTNGSLEGMRHEEFLDLSGEPPMRKLAERMIDVLGDSGPVFMYTDYEKRVIDTLIWLFPDLEKQLQAIIERLVDLAEIVKEHYYHPCMLGSWSVKKVAPAILPDMDYAKLEGINEGMGAANGYLEAIGSDTTPERKAELEEQLLRYCRFDTEAMVEIARFLDV